MLGAAAEVVDATRLENMVGSTRLYCHDEDQRREPKAPFPPSPDDEAAPDVTDSVSSILSFDFDTRFSLAFRIRKVHRQRHCDRRRSNIFDNEISSPSMPTGRE